MDSVKRVLGGMVRYVHGLVLEAAPEPLGKHERAFNSRGSLVSSHAPGQRSCVILLYKSDRQVGTWMDGVSRALTPVRTRNATCANVREAVNQLAKLA